MEIARGEIWWADLGTPLGSEPGYRCPVVVVSADSMNRSEMQTVIVVSLTMNLRLADAPGNVLLRDPANGLPRPSVADVSQVAAIDRSRLAEVIGRLGGDELRALNGGLRYALGV